MSLELLASPVVVQDSHFLRGEGFGVDTLKSLFVLHGRGCLSNVLFAASRLYRAVNLVMSSIDGQTAYSSLLRGLGRLSRLSGLRSLRDTHLRCDTGGLGVWGVKAGYFRNVSKVLVENRPEGLHEVDRIERGGFLHVL